MVNPYQIVFFYPSKKKVDFFSLRDLLTVPLFKTNNWKGGRSGPNGRYRAINRLKKIELKYKLKKSIKRGQQGISILDSSVFAEIHFRAIIK